VRLTIGLLTRDCAHLLPDQLASLEAGLEGVSTWRLVVADGGSTDGTVEVARQLAPHASIVELPHNPGFGALVNAAAAADPDSDLIFVLSRTGLLEPGCAAELMRAFGDPHVGVAVPWLRGRDGQPRPSLRRTPTLWRVWAEALVGGSVANLIPGLGELITPPSAYSANTRFAWATGGMTMFSRACFDAVGGWDETMFTYSEETDFELRARDLGFKTVFVPEAYSTHYGGDSKVRPELYAHLCANRIRLYAKRHSTIPAWLYWSAVVCGEVIRYPARPALHGAALRKVIREGRAITAGLPASHPFDPSYRYPDVRVGR
jgi:GT2 family glycosyltransferase